MVQAHRDQHPVGEAVDERSESPRAADELAQPSESGIEDRIEVAHGEGDYQDRQRDDDGYEAPPAEESQVGREGDGVIAVEQCRRHQTDHDPAEHAVVDLGLLAG